MVLTSTTNVHQQEGVTALSMAVQNQHTAVVDALILAGANMDLAEYVRTVQRINIILMHLCV